MQSDGAEEKGGLSGPVESASTMAPVRNVERGIVTTEWKWLSRSGGQAGTAAVKSVEPKWRMRRMTSRVARAPFESRSLAAFSRIAADLKTEAVARQIFLTGGGLPPGAETVGVAITGTGRGNQQDFTAVAFGTLWARWGYPTLIIDLAGGHGAVGASFNGTSPTLTQIVQGIERGSDLPAPQRMLQNLEQLDVVADSGAFSLARLADSGLLLHLAAAVSQRYRRVVWSLPAIDGTWSARMLSPVVERFIVSARRGCACGRSIDALAREAADSGARPIQLVWYR